MLTLANIYNLVGRHDAALRLLEETLAAHKRVLPPDYPDTLRVALSIATSLEWLGRAQEALPTIDAALAAAEKREADPRLAPLAMRLRVQAGQLRADPAAVRAAVEKLVALNRTDFQSLYELGCATARLSATIRAADPSAGGQHAADVEAARAVGILKKTVAAGSKNYTLWERDPVLNPIRDRPDFQALLASIRPKETPHTSPK